VGRHRRTEAEIAGGTSAESASAALRRPDPVITLLLAASSARTDWVAFWTIIAWTEGDDDDNGVNRPA
jgi:hypothetical protein